MSPFEHSPWPRVRLGDLCADKDWVTPAANPEVPFEYVDIASVCNQRFEILNPKSILGRDAPSRARKRIRGDDVLVATTRPYLRSIARVPAELDGQVCSTGFCVLRPKAGVISDWIFFAVLGDDFIEQLTAKMRGANYPAVADSDVLDAVIPLPEVAEQRRIVSRIKGCMERVEEIQRLRQTALRERDYLTESLVEAELADLPGREVAMSDVCEIASRLVDPREPQFQSMLHVGGANIESRTGRLLDLKTAAEEGLKSGKFVFDSSVVLYNKIRPYLVKVARPDFPGLCSADMYPLTPKADLASRDFIYYVLMSRRFTAYAIAGSNRAGMPKVNREHLFAYRFTLPPLEIQRRICELLDSAIESVRQLGREMSDAASEMDQVRDSVLRKAFAGEL